ncbi:MAG: TonB-dependent receptor [Burkholderiales bacterium]|nr:TonB-dependent receptor [Burkholderiales bacterium]
MKPVIIHALLPVAAAVYALFAQGVQAQSAGAVTGPNKVADYDAPDVLVTAHPFGSSLLDMVQPADVLSGPKLQFKLQPSLGETLGNEVGVSSSYFGPGASRPIIRGLDGERIKILNNGSGVIDASGASPDHAVAYDPLVADRIEIVRGPATLLYGASAIGGVVNTIDNRIPTAAPDRGFSGSAQLRYGGAATERAGVVKLDGGTDRFALHVDAYGRKTDDLRIPDYQRSERLRARDPLPPGEVENRGRAVNSATESNGGAVGGSLLFDKGYVGASVSQLNANYGTVAEPDVTIDMRKNRYDFAGEFRDLGGFIDGVKFRTGYTDYKHTEFEGAEVGTVFKNRGYDGRVDLKHRKLGILEGVIGLQAADTKFEALGAEAFLPPVATRTVSAFVYEEAPLGPFRLSAGGRMDNAKVAADANPNFGGAESKSFTTKSGSLGSLYAFSEEWALAGNYSYNERAPNYAELFANGPHAATGQFEVGNRDQKIERSNAFDLALRKRQGFVTGSIGVFQQRFSNFIALLPTGAQVGDPGEELPEFRFQGVKANLRGIELDTRFHVIEEPQHVFHLDFRADYTRAQDQSNNQPLPRIAPLRVTIAANYTQKRFGARGEIIRASSQDRTAQNELPTDGYTLVNAQLSYQLPEHRMGTLELFLRANNLLDEDVRLHTSALKDLIPLGRRSVMVGVTGAF